MDEYYYIICGLCVYYYRSYILGVGVDLLCVCVFF
jgi:hypothetical protein